MTQRKHVALTVSVLADSNGQQILRDIMAYGLKEAMDGLVHQGRGDRRAVQVFVTDARSGDGQLPWLKVRALSLAGEEVADVGVSARDTVAELSSRIAGKLGLPTDLLDLVSPCGEFWNLACGYELPVFEFFGEEVGAVANPGANLMQLIELKRCYGRRRLQIKPEEIEMCEAEWSRALACIEDLYTAIADMSQHKSLDVDEFKEAVSKLAGWGVTVNNAAAEFDGLSQRGKRDISVHEFCTWAAGKHPAALATQHS